MDELKILTFTSLFPNAAQPRHGIFTEHRLRSLLATGSVETRVVAPVPWVPAIGKCLGRYGGFARVPRSDRRHGIETFYPRYPVVPKIGMTLAPLLMATAMIRPLHRIAGSMSDFDVLDAFYFYPDGVAAVLLGLMMKRPVVITAYGTDINLIARYYLPRRMIRWAAGRASAVTTVCHALKDQLVKLGVPAEKIHVIRHGVDLSLFRPPEDRAILRERLGLTRRTLLSVGHLIEAKGHHIAIEGMVELSDMDLLIVGEGQIERKLRRQVARLGLDDRVRLVGHVDQRNLAEYYGAADALVLPSGREGIPNVLLESMACGTPAVATRTGGIPEVMTAPAAGITMPERTAAALASAVRALFRTYPDPVETRRFAERFSWSDTAAQHLAVLQEVAAKSRQSRTT